MHNAALLFPGTRDNPRSSIPLSALVTYCSTMSEGQAGPNNVIKHKSGKL